MSTVAVVAHARKSFGGGLGVLRHVLAREGVTGPLWYEVKRAVRRPGTPDRAVAAPDEYQAGALGGRPASLTAARGPAAGDLRIKIHPRSITICVPA